MVYLNDESGEIQSVEIEIPYVIDKKCELIIEKFFNKLGLSARAYGRILKVSRTIADMEESKNIKEEHILEAIQYRNLDKKFRCF